MNHPVVELTETHLEQITGLMIAHVELKKIKATEDVLRISCGLALEHPSYALYGVFKDSDSSKEDETSDELVGLVTLSCIESGKELGLFSFIENLFVSSEVRHTGVATKLLKHVTQTSANKTGSFGIAVADSDLSQMSPLLIDHGFSESDSDTKREMELALETLPFERGFEGNLKYFIRHSH